MTLLIAFTLSLGYLWLFWLLYILTMGFYRASLAGRLTGARFWLAFPIVVLAIFLDLLANWTIAAAWFLEWPKVELAWPPKRPDLVTSRLTRYLAADYPEGRNKKHAAIICTQLLDPFDPSGSHCSDASEILS